MGSEAPSWADTWGTGGIGARDELDHHTETKKDGEDTKKKAGSKPGFKAVVKGTTNGIKWIKNKCQKKKSPKQDNSSE